jgi:hypothetical protein
LIRFTIAFQRQVDVSGAELPQNFSRDPLDILLLHRGRFSSSLSQDVNHDKAGSLKDNFA